MCRFVLSLCVVLVQHDGFLRLGGHLDRVQVAVLVVVFEDAEVPCWQDRIPLRLVEAVGRLRIPVLAGAQLTGAISARISAHLASDEELFHRQLACTVP